MSNEERLRKQVRLVFDVDYQGDPDAGLHAFSDRVTVIVDSGDPGGDPGEFQDAAISFLLEWFDGATIFTSTEPALEQYLPHNELTDILLDVHEGKIGVLAAEDVIHELLNEPAPEQPAGEGGVTR